MFIISNDTLIMHSVTIKSIHNQTPRSNCQMLLRGPGSKPAGTPQRMLQHRHMLSQVQVCRWM